MSEESDMSAEENARFEGSDEVDSGIDDAPEGITEGSGGHGHVKDDADKWSRLEEGPPRKKAKLSSDKPSLYKPPTSEELHQLRETENLFQSSLFRMQVGSELPCEWFPFRV